MVKVVKTWSKMSKYKRNRCVEGKDAKESTLSPAMSPMVTDYILCSSIKDTGSLIFLAFAFIIAPLIGLFLHAMVPCPSAAWHAAGVTSRIGFSSGSVAIRPPDHPKCPVLAGRSLLRRFLKEVARFAIRLHLIAT